MSKPRKTAKEYKYAYEKYKEPTGFVHKDAVQFYDNAAIKYADDAPKIAEDILSDPVTGSKDNVAVALGVSTRTLERWINPQSKHFKVDLAIAYERGYCRGHAKMLQTAFDALLNNKKLNPILFQMLMRKQYQWTEHRAVQIEGLDNCESYKDKINCIIASVAKGAITPAEAQYLSNSVSQLANVEKITEIEEKYNKMQKILIDNNLIE